jgi:transcriptional regulator with PAS, ATPase and Fis domain
VIRRALQQQPAHAELGLAIVEQLGRPDVEPPSWSRSPSMRAVMDVVDRVADSTAGVLLRGESGVGKEVVARELHRRSSRRMQRFVKVNCAALPGDLLESELFGYERGAFTGAGMTRIGKFEFAHRGTILLDEIAEIPVQLQAKLLHVLQDGTLTRLGSNQLIAADVRILAATNRDLGAMMQAGTFRVDLYYRLQVIEICVPPLRDRREEIPSLIDHFVSKYSDIYGRRLLRPSHALRDVMVEYSWPGNIRELENVIKRFVVLQDEAMIVGELGRSGAVAADATRGSDPAVFQTSSAHGPQQPDSVDLPALARAAARRAEYRAIDQTLVRFQGNRRKAATYLGVSYKTLLNKIKVCGISDRGVEH